MQLDFSYATYYSPVKTAIAPSPCHVESDQAERGIVTAEPSGFEGNLLNGLEMGPTTSQSMLMHLGALTISVLSPYSIVLLCLEIMALPFPSTKEV